MHLYQLQRTASGELEHAMADPSIICSDVKASYNKQNKKMKQKEGSTSTSGQVWQL